jgi:hypothetical protein
MTFAQGAAESSTEGEGAAATVQKGEASGGAAGGYEPQWSIGAGVGWSSSISYSASWQTGVIVVDPSVPKATVSLERTIGPRTRLVLGASGSIGRYRSDVPEGNTALEKNDYRQLSLGAGVRQIVTSAGAPVDVSLVFLAEGGILDSKLHWVAPYSVAPTQQTAWRLGASGGIAVDRELTRGLSVRVGTSVLGVTWTRRHTKLADENDLWSSEFSAGLDLEPYLELRLAF